MERKVRNFLSIKRGGIIFRKQICYMERNNGKDKEQTNEAFDSWPDYNALDDVGLGNRSREI